MTKEEVLKKKIGFIALGCDKNRVDLEGMIANISNAGFEITADENEANIIILNTCAFLQASRDEALGELNTIFELKKGNLEKIIVTGCLSRYKEMYKDILESKADLVVPITQNKDIVALIFSLYGAECDFCFDEIARILTTPNHIAYLKIAEGCNNRCAYCAIPNIRGKYVSRPMQSLIEEATMLAGMGVKELALVAQDVTNYGYDLYKKRSLIELLEKLEQIDGIDWIRLHYCYPELVDDELIDYIANSKKVVNYIDMPLQHIDDDILSRMNRKNNEQSTYEVVAKLKQAGISIRTTFMVGFPGEERKDFKKLVKFLKKQKLDNVGFFAYSNEVGTKAYDMANQISERKKQKRLKKVQKIQEAIYRKSQKKKIGQTVQVMIDAQLEDNLYLGRTYANSYMVDSVITVVALNPLVEGQIINAKITGAYGIDLIGEEENEKCS